MLSIAEARLLTRVALIACAAAFTAGSALAQPPAAPRVVPNALLTIDQNRSMVVERIVTTWGDALATADSALAPDELRALLMDLRADHLLAANLAGNLEGLRNVVANAITSTADVKSSLLRPKALGDAADDLVYTPVVPCRIVDTVKVGGAIPGGTRRNFVGTTATNFSAQGGSATNCGIPTSAVVVQAIATVVDPPAQGILTIYPFNVAQPAALNLVYPANRITTTAATIQLTKGQAFEFTAFLEQTTFLQVDVVGYFKAPGAPIGTVSNIATGTGLTGGPITTTGTIGIANGGVSTTQLANNAVTQTKLSPAGSPTAGQVLGTDGTNLQWQTVSGSGGSGIFLGNVGIGTATPASRLHVVSDAGQLPPRLQSSGTTSFAAGWDFYQFNAPKGYVGVPDPSAPIAPGEMILYGGPGTRTSIWSGQTRAISMDGIGNVGIGTANPVNGRLQVAATTGTGIAGTSPDWVGVVGASTTFEGVRGESSGGAAGVAGYSLSGTGIGTFGSSSAGTGIYGTTTSGTGVVGKSGSGTGVYGESSVASITAGGVFGKNLVSGGIGVIGEANIGTNPTGVYGASTSSSGFGMYARNSGGGRALFVDGAASQGAAFGGLAKAMLHVDSVGTILSCYNGVTGSSTSPCGFSVSHPVTGNYTVNFGFNVNDRFTLHQPFTFFYPSPTPCHSYIDTYPTINSITLGTVCYNSNVTTNPLTPFNVAFFILVF